MDNLDLYGICNECQAEQFQTDKGRNYIYMCECCGCTMEYDEFSGNDIDREGLMPLY